MVFLAEHHFVMPLCLIIGRITIKKGIRSVILTDECLKILILYYGISQSPVCFPYNCECLADVKGLASIRSAERKHGVSRMLRSKVIMTSALDEASFDSNLASDDYDDYICKPIDIMKFNDMLKKLDIIK